MGESSRPSPPGPPIFGESPQARQAYLDERYANAYPATDLDEWHVDSYPAPASFSWHRVGLLLFAVGQVAIGSAAAYQLDTAFGAPRP